MNRTELGKIMVDSIIDDYKASNEFSQDAINYVNKWFAQILNLKMAALGDKFAEELGKATNVAEVIEKTKAEFMNGMEKYNNMEKALIEAFEMLTGEDAEFCRPNPFVDKIAEKKGVPYTGPK